MIKQFALALENDATLSKLNAIEKAKLVKAVNRANAAINYVRRNGLPKQYIGIGKKVAARCNADPSALPDESVYAIDNVIARTVEDQNVYGQMMASVTTPTNKWESKNYKIDELNVNSAKNYPNPDKSFRDPTVFTIGIEPEKTTGMGFSIAYEIPWTDIQEAKGSIYSPDFYYALIAAERMGVLIDEDGWLGGNGQHMKMDHGLDGMINHASIQTLTTGTLTNYGVVRSTLINGLNQLKTCFQAGKVVAIMSSGMAAQMLINRQSYTDVSELEQIKKEFAGSLIQECWVSDRIIGATASTGNQVIALAKVGPTLCSHKIVYPLQSKPMTDKKYSDDIKEALIYGHIQTWYGNSPFPITVASSQTTSNTGVYPNGRLW